MRLMPVLVTPPAEMPVSVEDVRTHARIDHSEDDGLLERMIAAVTAELDGWRGVLGRALVTQTWRQDYCAFPRRAWLALPFGPVASITSVTYHDENDAVQTLPSSVYHGPFVLDCGPALKLQSEQAWPSTFDRPDAVSVTFIAGASPQAIPADLREAICQMVAHRYEHREPVVVGQSVNTVPMSAQAVIAKYRSWL